MTAVASAEPAGATSGGGAGTLPAKLLQVAAARPKAVAMRKKSLGRWKQYTWGDYAERAARVGLGLLELGVEPGQSVAVHSENRPAWLLADMGIQGIGAVTVGIYPTSPAAEVEYLLEHSESVVLIAEDEEQLDKVLSVREKLPNLRHIVVIDTRGVRDLHDPMLLTFHDLQRLGERRPIEEWASRVGALDPDETAIIVYTSGTTGPPKGAMLTHRNLVTAGEIFTAAFDARSSDEALSYLPMCHVAERLGSAIDALVVGYVVNFGESGESFLTDMQEVQPTIFLGVPRVWEKMMAGVQIRMGDASVIKKAVTRFWLARGAKLARKRMEGKLGVGGQVMSWLGWIMVFRSLRQKLGLGRVRIALSGAAPIAPQVLEFFWALGVNVREGYGQTEGTALATYTPADKVRIGKVGKALPQCEVRIADDGEILVRGPGVFKGYFKNDEATRQTVDADGWLHSGDVGELDADGFLTITDRKKDIIITAGGKNISPSEIENRLKVSPYVREAIVIGDQRKHLSALIGIEADTVGDWATRHHIPFTTYHDLSSKAEVRDLIKEWVDRVNADLAQVETVKRFELLPKELDHEEGELTATQKVKRSAIAKEFADLIEGMYG
ncbi:MAG: long-chain acyl-CoA synthetase [Acidimicrobiaceae bacterium]|nr:long-chain acyl-CoA synthetase [Acidimicrobiaceae bacterium]